MAPLRLICPADLFEILAEPLQDKDDQMQNAPRKASNSARVRRGFATPPGGKKTGVW
jgi:hypothetical protein